MMSNFQYHHHHYHHHHHHHRHHCHYRHHCHRHHHCHHCHHRHHHHHHHHYRHKSVPVGTLNHKIVCILYEDYWVAWRQASRGITPLPNFVLPSASKYSLSVIFKRAAATAAAAIRLAWRSWFCLSRVYNGVLFALHLWSFFCLSWVCNRFLFALRSRSFFCLSWVCNGVSFALHFFASSILTHNFCHWFMFCPVLFRS